MNLGERQIRWVFGGAGLGCFGLLMTLEVLTESDPFVLSDFLVDGLTMLLTIGAAVGVALLVQRMQTQHEEKIVLLKDLEIARNEGESWRLRTQQHLAGIRIEMEKQFEDWGMTAAEREIGMLILKGLSHKEVAGLRGTSEATVRQQAQSIYQKANLPGKTAFSAYFLEDLLMPEVAIVDSAMTRSDGAKHGNSVMSRA